MKAFITCGLLLLSAVVIQAQGPQPQIARRFAPGTLASLGTPVDNAVRWCTNCNAVSPCTSGGTGAYAYGETGGAWNCNIGAAGTGTVTSVSVTTANGISGTVADPTTTPAITLNIAALDATKVADGTVTSAEFQFINSLTSNAQTQIDAKSPTASPTFTGTVTIPTPFTLGAVSVLPTGTELNFVDGVTSPIQTQLDAKVDDGAVTTSGLTMATNKLLGRGTAATGAIEEVTLGTNLSFTGTTLNAASGVGGTTGIVDNAIPRADGTGGSTLQSSLVTIDDAGLLSGPTQTNLFSGATIVSDGYIAVGGSIFAVGSPAGSNISMMIENSSQKKTIFGSDNIVGWGDITVGTGTTLRASLDTAFARNGAGIVEVNSGTAGTLRDISTRNLVASTSLQFGGTVAYSAGTPSIAGNATLNTGSKDSAGKITSTGTGASTAVITFSITFTRAPACFVTNETTSNLVRPSSTTSALTVNATVVTGDSLSYICIGY